MAIWQDLVDEYGFASSYQSVQRFVSKLRGTERPEARAMITTAPGQEAQLDYGKGPMCRYLMTLAAKSRVRVTLRCSLPWLPPFVHCI